MRRAVGASVALAAALTVGGCIDFEPVTAPGQPGPAPVRLWVDARFADGPVEAVLSPVAVLVQLEPGRDEQGSRPVLGDTLWVDGDPVLPMAIGPNGESTYVYEGPASEDPDLRLRFPRLGRAGALPPEFHLHRPARLAADTLRITPEQELRLPLHPLASAAPVGSNDHEGWSVVIFGSTGRFDLYQMGTPPATIAVPPAMLPEPRADGTLHVDFRHYIDRTAIAERDLEINVRQSVRLLWTVEVVTPAESGAAP